MIYIISNERLEDEVANHQKIEDEAGGREQELAPPRKNTDEHARTSKDQRFDMCLGRAEQCKRVYIGGDLQSRLVEPIGTKGSTSIPGWSQNPG